VTYKYVFVCIPTPTPTPLYVRVCVREYTCVGVGVARHISMYSYAYECIGMCALRLKLLNAYRLYIQHYLHVSMNIFTKINLYAHTQTYIDSYTLVLLFSYVFTSVCYENSNVWTYMFEYTICSTAAVSLFIDTCSHRSNAIYTYQCIYLHVCICVYLDAYIDTYTQVSIYVYMNR